MDDGDDKFLRKGHPKDTAMEYANIEAQEEGGDVTRSTTNLCVCVQEQDIKYFYIIRKI